MIDGVINVYKERGYTSHDVVARLRGILRQKKIGHTGTLDPEAEAEVYTKFNDIVEDKTAIYISHRLSSCRFCDEVAVFDHGPVVQQGVHDALVEAEGKYRALWEAQAQYYRKEG